MSTPTTSTKKKMDIHKLQTVVFSGGGVRGLAFVGFMMAFQDTFAKTLHEHFEQFAGTSVGALFALVAVLDVDVHKSIDLFNNIGLDAIFHKDPTWLLTNFALNSGEALQELVIQLLALKGFHERTTMSELHASTNKTLVVVTVDLLTGETLYLDHTNEGSSISVVQAVMGSMALPPMFPPVTCTGSRGPMVLSDGGLLDNFAIARFDPASTLGVRTAWYIEPSHPLQDISTYYTRVLSLLQLTMHSMQAEVAREYPNVTYIDLGPIKADNADIDIQDLIFRGYRATISRLANASAAQLGNVEVPTKFLADGPLQMPAYIQKLRK